MIVLPAFFYMYTSREYPARGAVAWAVLQEAGGSIRRAEAVRLLGERLGISGTNARILLRRGEGLFWTLYRRKVRAYSLERLWRAVAHLSVVARGQRVAVPTAALRSVRATRAYLAQAALSRGPGKPVAVEASARLLGCGRRTVANYRQCLVAGGRMQVHPQWHKLRPASMKMGAAPLGPGEFIKGGDVYKRGPDVPVLLNGAGEAVLLEPNVQSTARPQPRRYFHSLRQVQEWAARGREVAVNALIRIYHGAREEWEPIANVLSAVEGKCNTYSTLHTTHKPFALNKNRLGACATVPGGVY